MKKFTDIFTKYGVGLVLGAATLDGYRRQVLSDNTRKQLGTIDKLKDELNSKERVLFDKEISIQKEIDSNKIRLNNMGEAKKEYEDKLKKYQENKSDYNKSELDAANKKFNSAFENLKNFGIGDLFSNLYDNYVQYLSTLTPDKIVALFNIIMGTLTLSSFFTVMSIMLSEQIINKIQFLEKYPKILKALKLRNNINKGLNKFYLIMHLILVIITILGNLFMLIL